MFQIFFFSLLHGPAQKQPSAINVLHFHFFKDKLNIDIPNRRITRPLKSPQIQARECQKARPLMQKSYLAAITVLRLQKFKHKLKGIIHQEATAIKAERTPFESNLPRPVQPSLGGCSSVHAVMQFLQWCSGFWNPERKEQDPPMETTSIPSLVGMAEVSIAPHFTFCLQTSSHVSPSTRSLNTNTF